MFLNVHMLSYVFMHNLVLLRYHQVTGHFPCPGRFAPGFFTKHDTGRSATSECPTAKPWLPNALHQQDCTGAGKYGEIDGNFKTLKNVGEALSDTSYIK